MVSGIAGTVCGSELSKLFSRYTRKAEAFVCSISLLGSIPFLYLSLTVVQYKVIYVSWVTVFMAIFFVCLNWTPVAAMLLVSYWMHAMLLGCASLSSLPHSTRWSLPEEPRLPPYRSCSLTCLEMQSVLLLLEQ